MSKQEAINTFSGGVTYDINPLTTPNTILTDCVNGTFITFNADELALQNDAGNTKIMVPGTEADPQYVQLSEGFYPLGIKEYGGILYIISGKYPTIVPEEFNDAEVYIQGDVVYKTFLNTKYYYESLAYNNIAPLPINTNEYWLVIGGEVDFINRYGEVEFGSYPSPEIINSERFHDEIDYTIVNDVNTVAKTFKFELYKPQVINNSIFQAGVYVTFNVPLDAIIETDNISFEYIPGGDPFAPAVQNKRIYKVKLYQQLTNGFLDLTNDVWDKYAIFVKEFYDEDLNSFGDPKFWFTDSNFKYYCPHNYKGKLVISIELEELDIFKGHYLDITIIEEGGLNYYNVFFPMDYENTSMWNSTYTNVSIFYTLDGSNPKLYTDAEDPDNTTQKVEHLSVDDINLRFLVSEDYTNKTLNYKIIPEFSIGEDVYTPFQDYLPQEFIDRQTLVGGRVLVTGAEEIEIRITAEDIALSYCDGDSRHYPQVTLTDGDGNFIDGFGDISAVGAYKFYEFGTTIPSNPLGTYVIGEQNTPITVTPNESEIAPGRLEFITNLVLSTNVQNLSDVTCIYRTVIVYVNTYTTTIPFVVTSANGQANVDWYKENGVISDNRKFAITYIPTDTITITPKESLGYDSSYITTLTDISTNITINFALVSKINISKVITQTGTDQYTVECSYHAQSVTCLPYVLNFETTLQNIEYYSGTIFPLSLGNCTNTPFYRVTGTDELRSNGDYIFDMVFNFPLVGDVYSNIVDTNFSKVGENNNIFPTNYTITAIE